MVLEDEPLIRQLLVANLEQEGFEVFETEDGVETVKHYIESYHQGNPFDLVIAEPRSAKSPHSGSCELFVCRQPPERRRPAVACLVRFRGGG